MTTPFVGEIQMFGFNYNPQGWAFCNGAIVPISQNSVLFALLGVTYGGNGTTHFQLPNLVARAACSQGQGPALTARQLGDTFGAAEVTLVPPQIPVHSHGLTAFQQSDANKRSGAPSVGGGLSQPGSNAVKPFSTSPPTTPMAPDMLAPTVGTTQPHSNQQPYLAVNFCIALQGVFPDFS